MLLVLLRMVRIGALYRCHKRLCAETREAAVNLTFSMEDRADFVSMRFVVGVAERVGCWSVLFDTPYSSLDYSYEMLQEGLMDVFRHTLHHRI